MNTPKTSPASKRYVYTQLRVKFRLICRVVPAFIILSGAGIFAVPATPKANANPNDALPDAPQAQSGSRGNLTIRALPANVLKDQAAIWTSPFHIRGRDLIIVAPLVL